MTQLKMLFVLLMGLLLAGCVEIEFHIKINSDGSENITAKLIAPSVLGIAPEDIIKDFKDRGYGVTTKSEGDKFVVIGTKTLPKSHWEFPTPDNRIKKNPAKNEKFNSSMKNWLFFNTYSFSGEYLIEQKVKVNDSDNPFDKMKLTFPVRYIIELPGKVTANNATSVFGTTMKWEYNLGAVREQVNVSASSYSINYGAIVVATLILIGLILVAFLKPSLRKMSIITMLVLIVTVPLVIYLNNEYFAAKELIKENNIKPATDVSVEKLPDTIGIFKLGQKGVIQDTGKANFNELDGDVTAFIDEHGVVDIIRFGAFICDVGDNSCENKINKYMTRLTQKFTANYGKPINKKDDLVIWESSGRRLQVRNDYIGGNGKELAIYVENIDETKPGGSRDGFKEFYQRFIAAINKRDANYIIGVTHFPLDHQEHCFDAINDKDDFIKRFDDLFPQENIKMFKDQATFDDIRSYRMYYSNYMGNGYGFKRITGKWYFVGYQCAE